MSSTTGTVTGLAIAIGGYAAFVCEASLSEPSVLPHAPAAFLAWAAWSAPCAFAIVAAALVGFGCDLIGTGPLGPGVIAGTVVSLVAVGIRRRWKLESMLAFVMFATVTSGALLTTREWGLAILAGRTWDLNEIVMIAGARGCSTAVLAIVPIVVSRCVNQLRRVMAAM